MHQYKDVEKVWGFCDDTAANFVTNKWAQIMCFPLNVAVVKSKVACLNINLTSYWLTFCYGDV